MPKTWKKRRKMEFSAVLLFLTPTILEKGGIDILGGVICSIDTQNQHINALAWFCNDKVVNYRTLCLVF